MKFSCHMILLSILTVSDIYFASLSAGVQIKFIIKRFDHNILYLFILSHHIKFDYVTELTRLICYQELTQPQSGERDGGNYLGNSNLDYFNKYYFNYFYFFNTINNLL